MPESHGSTIRPHYLRQIVAVLLPGASLGTIDAESTTQSLETRIRSAWDDSDRELLIDLGREELSRQIDRIDEVRTRSQILFTTGLALGAILAASFASYVRGGLIWTLFWWVAITCLGIGVAGAVAVMVAPAPVEVLSTRTIAEYETPIQAHIAIDVAMMVDRGDLTMRAKLVMLRYSVLWVLLGATIAGIGRVGSLI